MKTTVITIALAMMTVVAFGQENQQTKATDKIQTEEKAQTENKVQTRRGPYFVDKNNNGICDNFEADSSWTKIMTAYATITKVEIVKEEAKDLAEEVRDKDDVRFL